MLQQQFTIVPTIVGLVLVFLLSACGEHEALPPIEPPRPARIELGAGRVDFIPIEDSDSVELVSGPQGGHHLEFTLRLFDVDPDDLVLDYQVHDTTSNQRVSMPARYVIAKGYVIEREDHLLRVGDRAILDVKTAMTAQGMNVNLSCRIERQGATLAEDKKKATIIDEIDELGP
jgi:hypothetical protein